MDCLVSFLPSLFYCIILFWIWHPFHSLLLSHYLSHRPITVLVQPQPPWPYCTCMSHFLPLSVLSSQQMPLLAVIAQQSLNTSLVPAAYRLGQQLGCVCDGNYSLALKGLSLLCSDHCPQSAFLWITHLFLPIWRVLRHHIWPYGQKAWFYWRP